MALRHHARALLCVYGIALAYFSFYPFELVDQWAHFAAGLRQSIESPFDITGVSRHVLAFALLGFLLGMTALETLRPRQVATLLAILAVLLITIEVIQAAIPNRHSRAGDVLIHLASASVGVAIATGIGRSSRLMASLQNAVRPLWIVLGAFTLLTIAAVILIVHPFGSSFANWRTDFPLVLGNEPTADRAWKGWLHGIAIYDRALAPEAIARLAGASFHRAEDAEARHALQPLVLAAFDEGSGTVAESTARGSPPLTFAFSSADVRWLEERSGIALGGSEAMLQSLQPPAWLSTRLRDTSALTVELVVATRDTTQAGPARIVAWSDDPSRGNLIIGQQRAALVMRVRTPTSPGNGARHGAIWYGVLRDGSPRHIALTYDGRNMRAFVDGEERFQLHPHEPIDLALRSDNWRVPVAIVLWLYGWLGICGCMLWPRLGMARRLAVTGGVGLVVPAVTVLTLKHLLHPAPELAALLPVAAAAVVIGDVVGAKSR